MRCAHFSFGARGADRSWELSRPLNSMQDRRAVRKRPGARRGSVLAGGLKGSLRLSMCQAQIRSLRATADFAGFLPCRADQAGNEDSNTVEVQGSDPCV
jgi:hypothetical protein